jgi:hypothetical protein
MRRSFRRDSRGQVIIITGLLVALLLLSTAVCVIEMSKFTPKADETPQTVTYVGLEANLRNAVISGLANVTGGGNASVLAMDLDLLKAAILSHSYQTMFTLDYSLQNDAPYMQGLWVSWGNTSGVSGASASFTVDSQNAQGTSKAQYAINVTTQVTASGGFVQLNGTAKQVSLSVAVFNEGNAALTETMNLRFFNVTEWVDVTAPVVTDFGNGTYAVTFFADGTPVDEPLYVSAECVDMRGISVGVNIVCNRV